MKYILLSDIHFSDKQPVGRDDDIYLAGLEKLNTIFDHACSIDAHILHSGDLFHEPRNWKCLNSMIDLFHKHYSLKGKFNCVYGQHDMYKLNKSDTCLSVLENIGFINILNENPPNYGVSWGGELPKKMMRKESILVIHKSITDSETMFDTVSAKDFINSLSNTFVLCGDIHKRFVVDGGNNSKIVNTGPIIRRNIEEKDHKPCYAVFDTVIGDLKWYFLPDKAKFSEKHIELKEEQKQSKIDLAEYIESLGRFKKTADFKQNLIDLLSKIDETDIREKIESYLK